jgi:hypothetical protein
MKASKSKETGITHLHWGWNDEKAKKRDPLHIISIGIAVCGAGNLPRGTFFNDPAKVTCKKCLARMKNQPPPEPEPEPEPVKKRSNRVSDEALIGTIVKLRDNPRKAGSGAHTRMNFLLEYAGKSVAEYAKDGGNLTTLKNAIQMKVVKLRIES